MAREGNCARKKKYRAQQACYALIPLFDYHLPCCTLFFFSHLPCYELIPLYDYPLPWGALNFFFFIFPFFCFSLFFFFTSPSIRLIFFSLTLLCAVFLRTYPAVLFSLFTIITYPAVPLNFFF